MKSPSFPMCEFQTLGSQCLYLYHAGSQVKNNSWYWSIDRGSWKGAWWGTLRNSWKRFLKLKTHSNSSAYTGQHVKTSVSISLSDAVDLLNLLLRNEASSLFKQGNWFSTKSSLLKEGTRNLSELVPSLVELLKVVFFFTQSNKCCLEVT